MDQNAFRNLLNKPSTSSNTTQSQARKLGSAPKRGITGHTKPIQLTPKDVQEKKERADRAAATSFKPRATSRYKDRAEERRLGLENEFKDVDQLNEEFEGQGGDEEKRAFLGGDAKHSVLVKGLDRALLAQRKAELQLEQNADLDTELEAIAAGRKSASPQPEIEEKKPKSKAEILADLKASQAASLGSKFKSIASAAPEKKKKKKKKKVVEEVAPALAEPVPDVVKEPSPPPVPVVKAPPKPPKFAIAVDDDQDDIFNDVAEYQLGIPSDGSDSEDEVVPEPESMVRSRSASMEMDIKDEPEPERKRSRTRSHSRSRSPAIKRARTRSPSPIAFDPANRSFSPSEDEDEEDEFPTRLVPLESSNLPSARDLLALDSEAAKADAKRARKAKWRAQQGLAAQDGADTGEDKGPNEKQKLNREYQLLQNKMSK